MPRSDGDPELAAARRTRLERRSKPFRISYSDEIDEDRNPVAKRRHHPSRLGWTIAA